jgi:putative ABC transport system ATP-binding protein
LILADEPTANLDTANGEQVMTMTRLNQETGNVSPPDDPRIKFARRVITLRTA